MKARTVLTAIVGVLGLASWVYADTYPRQPGIKILQYQFVVTLGDVSDELTVKDTIDLQFLQNGVRSIDLDLCKRIQNCSALRPVAQLKDTTPIHVFRLFLCPQTAFSCFRRVAHLIYMYAVEQSLGSPARQALDVMSFLQGSRESAL